MKIFKIIIIEEIKYGYKFKIDVIFKDFLGVCLNLKRFKVEDYYLWWYYIVFIFLYSNEKNIGKVDWY